MAAVIEYNEDFIEQSVTLGAQMRHLRHLRDRVSQHLRSLSLQKMELQLTRRSLVVVNALIAKANLERQQLVDAIDAINQTHARHLASICSRR